MTPAEELARRLEVATADDYYSSERQAVQGSLVLGELLAPGEMGEDPRYTKRVELEVSSSRTNGGPWTRLAVSFRGGNGMPSFSFDEWRLVNAAALALFVEWLARHEGPRPREPGAPLDPAPDEADRLRNALSEAQEALADAQEGLAVEGDRAAQEGARRAARARARAQARGQVVSSRRVRRALQALLACTHVDVETSVRVGDVVLPLNLARCKACGAVQRFAGGPWDRPHYLEAAASSEEEFCVDPPLRERIAAYRAEQNLVRLVAQLVKERRELGQALSEAQAAIDVLRRNMADLTEGRTS